MKETNPENNDYSQKASSAEHLTVADRIQLLVDNELDPLERAQLFEELDQLNDGWKNCAVAFCNEQFLKNEFRSLEQSPLLLPKQNKSQPITKTFPVARSGKAFTVLALAVSLILGVGMGIYFGQKPIPGIEHTVAVAEQASVRKMVQEAKDLVSSDKKTNSLPIDLPIIRLFELENNEYRAVYLSPDPLPGFILQSMVYAGHEVEVSREHIETNITNNRTISVPIYELRVTKDQRFGQVAQSH